MKIEQADKWFSLYIRLRDADEQGFCKCVTCGKVGYFKTMHNGHFVNRKFNALRFNEINCNVQCPYCNTYCEGNLAEYSLYLIDKYGAEIVKKLIATKQTYFKMGSFEVQTTADFYKRKAKEQAKLRNIKL